jgi:hypothetical protein
MVEELQLEEGAGRQTKVLVQEEQARGTTQVRYRLRKVTNSGMEATRQRRKCPQRGGLEY